MEIISNDADEFKTRTKLTLSDVKVLIDLCLKKCYFSWNDEIRLLEDAGPIGLSLMVVVAEAFLQYIEKKCYKCIATFESTCIANILQTLC